MKLGIYPSTTRPADLLLRKSSNRRYERKPVILDPPIVRSRKWKRSLSQTRPCISHVTGPTAPPRRRHGLSKAESYRVREKRNWKTAARRREENGTPPPRTILGLEHQSRAVRQRGVDPLRLTCRTRPLRARRFRTSAQARSWFEPWCSPSPWVETRSIVGSISAVPRAPGRTCRQLPRIRFAGPTSNPVVERNYWNIPVPGGLSSKYLRLKLPQYCRITRRKVPEKSTFFRWIANSLSREKVHP